MTNIKIHGQKMQFHKRVAISVALSAGTGGTATYVPETGQPTLSSLPVGVQIVKSNGDYLIKYNNTTIGAIELYESSGYGLDDIVVRRGGVDTSVTTTPITLQDGDTIAVTFEANTIRIYLDAGSYGAFYGEYGEKISYVDMPRVDAIRLNPMQNNVDGRIEAYYDGLWITFAHYSYSAGNVASFTALNTPYQIQIEFEPGYGNYYYFPDMWNLPSGYQYLDNSTFIMELKYTCDLVSYSKAKIKDPSEITTAIEHSLYQNYPSLIVQQWRSPSKFYYIFYDGTNRYGIGRATCLYPGLNPGEMINGEAIVPFYYDGYNTYSTPFDRRGFARGELPYWDSTGYSLDPSLLDRIFSQGDTNAVQSLESGWKASNVCDLGTMIYNLATNK